MAKQIIKGEEARKKKCFKVLTYLRECCEENIRSI
jgi:hypothetical protein